MDLRISIIGKKSKKNLTLKHVMILFRRGILKKILMVMRYQNG
jgi:hypothetical protein